MSRIKIDPDPRDALSATASLLASGLMTFLTAVYPASGDVRAAYATVAVICLVLASVEFRTAITALRTTREEKS